MTSRDELNLLLIDDRNAAVCLDCPLAQCVWESELPKYLCPIERGETRAKGREIPDGYVTTGQICEQLGVTYNSVIARMKNKWHLVGGIRRHLGHKFLIPAREVERVAGLLGLYDL